VTDLLKNPATIASGLFATVAAVFNIPFVDGLALYVWANINQLFYISSLLVTIGEQIPIPEGWATQALVITGIVLLVKLLWDAGNDLDDAVEDS
jgi:hypothetical protein